MASGPPCTHLDQVLLDRLPEEVAGCEERHASRHAAEAAHPLVRSLEPGEDWSWCFLDEVGLILDRPAGTTRIPKSPLLP
jgi:hypothetical protein